MLAIALKFIAAHLIGDFVLQPKHWVENRNEKIVKSKYLYFHTGVHALLLTLMFFTEIKTYYVALLFIVCSHFVIDLAKSYAHKKNSFTPLTLFITDQFLHLIVIGIVLLYYHPIDISIIQVSISQILLLLITLLLATKVSSITLKLFFLKWNNSQNQDSGDFKSGSLKNAGSYIGIAERLLIILFINISFYGGIGFLLAAKSIFRFGDLTNAKDKKLTEYILLGTLMSFTLAVVIGLGLKFMRNLI